MTDSPYIDVLAVTSVGDWDVPDAEHDAFPPVATPFDLGPVALDRPVDWEALLDACVPPAHSSANCARQDWVRYTFIRKNAPGNGVQWDPDGILMSAVALSRLVRPNDADATYAARLHVDGTTGDAFPLSNGFSAYMLVSSERRWLTAQEAQDLRCLLDRWLKNKASLPERVRHALWMHEHAWRLRYLEVRLPHTVGALEALLNAGSNERQGEQFRRRVPLLAASVGHEVPPADVLRDVWKLRSKWSHGELLSPPDAPELSQRLATLERILALAIRRAIEDRDFADVFSTAAKIRARFPLGTSPSSP